MKKIEAMVEAEELADIRDALREMGVRTIRVAEVAEEPAFVEDFASGDFTTGDSEVRAKVRISVVVPDDLTDRVILTLLASVKGGGVDTEGAFVSSIQHVVRLEAAGYFDDIF